MNVLLWVCQAVLAVFAFSGGAYKLFNFEELAQVPATAALPQVAWSALGVFEIVCAVLLIVPAATRWMPILTPIAATALVVESLVLAVLNAQYSLSLTATNPLVWVVAMGLMAAFVAYGRYVLRPLA
jgi:hypothetical protein